MRKKCILQCKIKSFARQGLPPKMRNFFWPPKKCIFVCVFFFGLQKNAYSVCVIFLSPKNHPNLENIRGFFKISPMFFINIENLKDLSLNKSRTNVLPKKRLKISMILSKILKTLGPRASSFFSNVFQNYWKSQGGAGFLRSTVSINPHYGFRHMHDSSEDYSFLVCDYANPSWHRAEETLKWIVYARIMHITDMVETHMQ